MNELTTRREFVVALALLGASLFAMEAEGCAPVGGGNSVPTPSSTYEGDDEVSKRILVGYATGTGSTTGVAQAIGQTLADRGFIADVKPMKERPSLDGYDAVVLGSAINGGQWLPEGLAYVEENQRALHNVPVSFFCVHAMNCGPDPKKTAKRLAYLDKVRALVNPSDEAFFAGKGPSGANSNVFTRWAFRAFGGDVEGDGRDWEAIKAWAEGVPV